MARKIGKDVLEGRIENAQEDVVKAKKKYDAATATLKQLLDKRQAMRAEEVMVAIAKSKRKYEDIINYINSNGSEESDESLGPRGAK